MSVGADQRMIRASTVIIMTLSGFQTALVVLAANAGQVVVRIADAAMVLLVSGEMGMVILLACPVVMALPSQILLIFLSRALSLNQRRLLLYNLLQHQHQLLPSAAICSVPIRQ